MKTDRELLELAAKAVGRSGVYQHWEDSRDNVSCGIAPNGTPGREWWNPLRDDGACARLEAELRIDIEWQRIGVVACHRAESGHDIVAREPYADHLDRQSARRMASLRVAAGIQEAKETP